MSTTTLVVEIVIIGVQVSIWLACLLLSVSFDWVKQQNIVLDKELITPILIVIFAIAYPLGIAVDRGADALFRWLNKTTNLSRRGTLSRLSDIKKVKRDLQRMVAYMNEDRSIDLIEYPRSRLRIARATTLNAVLIGVSVALLVKSQGHLIFTPQPDLNMIAISATVIGVLVSLLSFYAAVEVQVTEDVRTELIISLIPHKQKDGWINLDLAYISEQIAIGAKARIDDRELSILEQKALGK